MKMMAKLPPPIRSGTRDDDWGEHTPWLRTSSPDARTLEPRSRVAEGRFRFCTWGMAILLLTVLGEQAQAGKWWREEPQEMLLQLPRDASELAERWSVQKTAPELKTGQEGTEEAFWSAPQRGTSEVLSKVSLQPPYVLRARVRIHAGAWVVLYLGVDPTKSSDPERTHQASVVARPFYRGMTVDWKLAASPLHSLSGALRDEMASRLPGSGKKSGALSALPLQHRVSPLADPDDRRELESANASAPEVLGEWADLEVTVRDGRITFRFMGQTAESEWAESGHVCVRLVNGAELGSLSIVRPEGPRTDHGDRFAPLGLRSSLNCQALQAKDRSVALASGSLPPPDTTVRVASIPFVFPRPDGGNDHVDLGENLFRYRRTQNNDRTGVWHMWPQASQVEAGATRLSVPQRPWKRLWLVAASDGEADSVPIVSVRFYKPRAGYPIDAAGTVPLFAGKNRAKGARRLPVRRPDGAAGSLWLVPIELDGQRIASELREFNPLTMELTNEVHPWRDFPDPCNYGYFPGGLPSSVRVFAATLEAAPLSLLVRGGRPANAFVSPEKPTWQTTICNWCSEPVKGTLTVAVIDPYGKREAVVEHEVIVPSWRTLTVEDEFSPAVYGRYEVESVFHPTDGLPRNEAPDVSEIGHFVQLPPDTRKTNQDNSRWGFWTWLGGHDTNPDLEENYYILRAVGARGSGRRGGDEHLKLRKKWGIFYWPNHLSGGPQHGEQIAKLYEEAADVGYQCLFAERAVSMRVTYGTPREYMGEEIEGWDYTEAERNVIDQYTKTALETFKAVREKAPKFRRLALGWCNPGFHLPFLQEKFPKDLFDAMGIDFPTFERMPEMPNYDLSPQRTFFLKEYRKRYGYLDKPVVSVEAAPMVTNHPLALGPRVGADYYVRHGVLQLALGVDRFQAAWSLIDCAGAWGSQHYGCSGIVGRRPMFDPHPALPAFATMTRLLDLFQFDGYVPLGTLSAYCVRFKNLDRRLPHQYVYCLWTLRGRRPATLAFQAGKDGKSANAALIDEHSNETPLGLQGHHSTVTLTTTPVWITTDLPIEKGELGTPIYTEKPGHYARLLDTFDSPWTYDAADYPLYSQSYPDGRLETWPGPMKSEVVDSAERFSKVWRVTLQDPPEPKTLGAWFGVYEPKAPIAISGKARALGVWVNGCSNWGRFVYEIRDAEGETFVSCGTKLSWNCNDGHQWSFFNFDGWRYVEFPLPGSLPYDDYREADSVWWGSEDGDGIVDLPISLTKLVVEHRTHNIYVDEMVASPGLWAELDDLTAVYDDAEMMTDAPVALQQRTKGKALERSSDHPEALANPIADLQEKGVGAAAVILKIYPPETWNDGKRAMVDVQPVEGAKEYRIYVSAYESGAGAVRQTTSKELTFLVLNLRPEFPIHFFATYVDKDGKESKPSKVLTKVLKDEFFMK